MDGSSVPTIGQKVVCVIPARLASTRLPEKILRPLGSASMLEWVWRRAKNCPLFDEVCIALDDEKTAALVEGFGGRYVMTSKSCQSGTERLIEVMHKQHVDGDIWVNWQADEPFIHTLHIEELLTNKEDMEVDVWTLKTPCLSQEDFLSPHAVKVVCDKADKALYFSRAPIPYNCPVEKAFIHVGLYAYRKHTLEKLGDVEPSMLQLEEQLEQLTFLYEGYTIQVATIAEAPLGVNTPEDLARAEEYVANMGLTPYASI